MQHRDPTGPGHGARKRFGQHFLVDAATIEHIVKLIAPCPGQRLIEIGPGRGALTRALLAAGAEIDAVEIDRDLVRGLRSEFGGENRLRLIEGDALRFDFASLTSPGGSLRIVGNLPYNISTPLLMKLLRLGPVVSDLCLMLQREVCDRLVAQPGTSDYGRLSVMTQAFSLAALVLEVPPGAFAPPPRVESAVVLLRPVEAPPCVFEVLERIVAMAFLHRRKMLKQGLGKAFGGELLERLGIRPTDRPENVTVQQFIELARVGFSTGSVEKSVGQVGT